jgi:hypothetical protein
MKRSDLGRMCRFISVFGKVGEGMLQKKDVTKSASKASKYMKTNKSRAKCPRKIRTFLYYVRTFLSNRHGFRRKMQFCDDIESVKLTPQGFGRGGVENIEEVVQSKGRSRPDPRNGIRANSPCPAACCLPMNLGSRTFG